MTNLTKGVLGPVRLGFILLGVALCLWACQGNTGESPELPAQSPELPTRSPELPTRSPELPTRSPELPAQSPELPTRSPELPAQSPELPTRSSERATRSPDFTPIPSAHPFFDCGPIFPLPWTPGQHFVSRTPDGSQLVFSGYGVGSNYADGTIWKVGAESSGLQMVLDANPGFNSFPDGAEFVHGFHADLSPDGARLVYTSCQFPGEFTSLYSEQEALALDGGRYYERGKFHYEIASSMLDGSNQQRLTHGLFGHYPVWSPGSDRIAFRSSYDSLYVMSADGDDVQLIVSLPGARLYPPAWSPDGQRLAFVVNAGPFYSRGPLVVYTVRSDGSELVKIGEMGDLRVSEETPAAPTWSPDSERVGFARFDGREAIIHTVRPDGTDLRSAWSSGLGDSFPPISQVSWSPDGSEIRFVAEGIYTVGVDGSGLRELELDIKNDPEGPPSVAWSPDGTRVAVYYSPYSDCFPCVRGGPVLITVLQDGADMRVLVFEDGEGRLHASN